MTANPLVLGRMGFELSTCSAGSETLLKKIIQRFGVNGRIGASRYGYELFVDLSENSSTGQFDMKNIYFRFLRQVNNSIMEDILEKESNGGLSEKDKRVISEELEKTSCSFQSKLAMFSAADVFKYFVIKSQYKMAVLSTIVSYGRDISMSHQCAIMVLGSPHNMFLFYEPYGMYNKYGFAYKEIFGKILGIFKNMEDFKSYGYATYHDYFGINKGIQNLMLDYGKAHEEDFLTRYNAIKQKLVESGVVDGGKWKYEGDDTDKTFAICTLMDYATDYPPVLRESAELYYEYSAKTCVSIFMAELTKLLMLVKSDNTRDSISQALNTWYEQFQDKTTSILLNKLDHLMRLLYDEKLKNKIYGVFENIENSPAEICEFLISEKS